VRVILSAISAIAVVCSSLWPISGNSAPTYSPLMSGGEQMGKLIGGNGGGPFQSRCPAGESYLAGLEVTTDERVSTIKLMCAVRQGNNLVNAMSMGSDIGRVAYDRHSRICPNGGAINSIQVQSDGYDVIGVWSIALRCSDAHGVLPIGEPNYATLAGTPQLTKNFSSPNRIDGVDECPAGYIAKGVWGHSGLFIDSIGLICDWVAADPPPPVSNAGRPIKITGAAGASPRPTSGFDGNWSVTSNLGNFEIDLLLVNGRTMGAELKGNPGLNSGAHGVQVDATHAQLTLNPNPQNHTGSLSLTLGSDGNSITGSGTLSDFAVTLQGTRMTAAH